MTLSQHVFVRHQSAASGQWSSQPFELMVVMDPTEAIRSADIREVLSKYFTIVEERPYSVALLHLGLAEIAQNLNVADPEAVEHLRRSSLWRTQ